MLAGREKGGRSSGIRQFVEDISRCAAGVMPLLRSLMMRCALGFYRHAAPTELDLFCVGFSIDMPLLRSLVCGQASH